jgi:hypothetical protein
MEVTKAMIKAAQRGEFDYYQRMRLLPPDKFIPTDEPIIRAMLEAALKGMRPEQLQQQSARKTIVTAPPPRRRR